MHKVSISFCVCDNYNLAFFLESAKKIIGIDYKTFFESLYKNLIFDSLNHIKLLILHIVQTSSKHQLIGIKKSIKNKLKS